MIVIESSGQTEKKVSDLLKVTGTVFDEQGLPLVGTTIQDLTSKKGVTTEFDGSFEISVKAGSVLRFSYISMETKDITITTAKHLKVILKENLNMIDETVVTGYTTTTKRRTTGSVAVIKAEDLDVAPTANIDRLIQGKIAGVDIKMSSGRPGETAKIRIRGTNTISGNAEPLWVVDGVVLQKDIPSVTTSQIKAGDFNDILTNGISGINPNDIETITVLKDASAAAIYGSRAASGVVVITTKRGKEGKIRINYSGTLSTVFKPYRDANLMNSAEKIEFEKGIWEEFSNEGFTNGKYFPVIGAYGMIVAGKGKYYEFSDLEKEAEINRLKNVSTDWFNELFQNSVSHTHFLSISGGNEKNTYYVSGGYSSNVGLVKNTDYQRYNSNLKFDTKINPFIKWGIIADIAYQKSNSPSLSVDPFKYAYFANPYEQPYLSDGSYAPDNTYFVLRSINGGYEPRLPENGFNIFREMNETSSVGKNMTSSITSNITIDITNNLKFEGVGYYSFVFNTSDNINGKNTYAAFMDRPFDDTFVSTRTYGSITQSSAYNSNYSLRGQLLFSKGFNKHHISALAGAEIRGSYSKSIYEKRYGYDDVSGNSSMPIYSATGSTIDYNRLISYAAIMDGLSGQYIDETAFASFYASVDYSYDGKYIVSLTARTDGSNNFGSKEQFNPTGSIGVAWNVDREGFMSGVKDIISSLSIRSSAGYTGNINKSVYPQLIMNYDRNFRKTLNDYYRMGYILNAPNPNLRWEKTSDIKVSLDAGFLRDRYRLLFEIYNRKSKDVVTPIRIPSTTGFNTQNFNTSEILNQGAELTLSAMVMKKKDLSLNISANIGYNLNKLTKYVSPTGTIYGSYYVGYPLASIFSGNCLGIDKDLGIYMFEARPDADLSTIAAKKIWK
jgi:TonB-linked outer membrane protein, SusC/RagA family/TonB-dependent outer membrane receptor, SusC/RagA subfamily, signature region